MYVMSIGESESDFIRATLRFVLLEKFSLYFSSSLFVICDNRLHP